MTYPESSCLIKLTSSESSTITNEKCLSYTIKNNQFKTSRAHNTDRVHNCRVKVVFIENDVKYWVSVFLGPIHLDHWTLDRSK